MKKNVKSSANNHLQNCNHKVHSQLQLSKYTCTTEGNYQGLLGWSPAWNTGLFPFLLLVTSDHLHLDLEIISSALPTFLSRILLCAPRHKRVPLSEHLLHCILIICLIIFLIRLKSQDSGSSESLLQDCRHREYFIWIYQSNSLRAHLKCFSKNEGGITLSGQTVQQSN